MSNRIRTETRRLMVGPSDEELQELAQMIQDRSAEEERQKGAKFEMKGVMEGYEERMQRLSNNIVRKQIKRDVEVDLMLEGVQVQEVRKDTGEIILIRPATLSELHIRFVEEPPGEAPAGA